MRVGGRFTLAPVLDATNEAYWTSGRAGVLTITACRACHRYLHPPTPVCRHCSSRDVAPTEVTGRGTVYSYSVNIQDWGANVEDEFVYVIVELEEQESLRVTSHLVDCPVGDIRIGLPVAVDFVEADEIWFPVFRPVPGTGELRSEAP